MKIISYLFVEAALIHRMGLRGHKRTLQLLEWTSARMEWWLADDSSEELELDEPPMLWSLRHVYANATLSRSCFSPLDRGQTVLDAIYTYLAPNMDAGPAEFHAHVQERTWDVYQWQGRYYARDNHTGEWFFLGEPPRYWRRYTWFVRFPRTASTMFVWWHHAARGRWFVEPRMAVLLQEAYEVAFPRAF